MTLEQRLYIPGLTRTQKSIGIPFAQMIELVRQAHDDSAKRQVLDKVSYDFYNKHAKPGDEQIFMPLRRTMQPIIIYRAYESLEPVIRELSNSRIPFRIMQRRVEHGPQMGINTYCFSFISEVPRIQQYLIENIETIPNARLKRV